MTETVKKVLFVANGPMIGGGNKSLISLCNALNSKGISTRVLVPSRGPFEKELIKNRIDFVIQPTQIYVLPKFKIIIEVLKCYLLVRSYRPCVIHTNDIHCYKYFDRIANLLRIPIVCHMRHFTSLKTAEFLIDKLPRHFLYNSYYNKEKTEADFKGTPLQDVQSSVAYNFFDIAEYYKPILRKAERERLNLDLHQIAIVVVGNINRGKGHIDFIHGIKYFLTSHPEYTEKLKVLIVGEDVTRSGLLNECKCLIDRLSLTKSIFFTGFMSNTAAVYAATDILVIPSEEEPFGRIAVEGVLAKKQIIANNTAGLKEILSPLSTPILYNRKNVRSFSNSLFSALTAKDADIKLASDQELVSIRFSEKTLVNELINIYEAS